MNKDNFKDKFILIAYKPDAYEDPGCSCCRGTNYDGDFEMNQFDNTDELANAIADYAKQNTQFDNAEGNYYIWIIYNGNFIIGHPNDNGHDPSKKLFDIMRFEYNHDTIEYEIVLEKILKELDSKIDIIWRDEVEKQKRVAQQKAETKKKNDAVKKLAAAKKKEESERKRLKELAKKYPEEIQ